MKKIISILPILVSITLFAQTSNHFLNGVAALERNEYEIARQELTMAIKDKNNINKSTFYRGICFFQQEQYDAAIKDFNDAAESKNNFSYFWLAKIYANKNDAVKAVFYIKKHLSIHGNSNYSEILKDPSFNQVRTTTTWNDFVSSYILTEQDEAIQDIQFRIKKGDFTQARELIQYNLNENSSAQIFVLSAKAYELESSYELAIYELKKAIELAREKTEYKITLGDYLSKSNNYQRAIEVYKEVLSESPEKFGVNLKLADSYLKNNEIAEAEKQIEYYQSFFPEDEVGLILASKIYLNAEDYTKALKQVNKLFKSEKIKAEYYLTRGNIYYQTGSYKYSAEDLSMYLDLTPNDPDANLQLGNAQKQLGNDRLACYYWQRALRLGSMEAIEQIQKNCKYTSGKPKTPH